MTTRLFPVMPFSTDMNYGRALNEQMDLLPEGSWMVALDHDAMWTTRAWFRQIQEAIAFRPDAGLFTAVTNRIAAPWQQVGDKNCHDIVEHRRVGRERLGVRTLLDITDTKGFGGVVIVISKDVWHQIGGFVDGLFCVDHAAHFAARDVGRRVFLMEGLYVYHWRRAHGDGPPVNAPRHEKCQCRGPETPPTERTPLP